jgi:eukaryotic translation initiation factor 2C
MVGSVDYSAGLCLGSSRLQRIEKSWKDEKGNARVEQITDREVRLFLTSSEYPQLMNQIIQEVEAMVTERLEDWIRLSAKKTLPKNILYYRDGVSVTQYVKVKTTELEAIREAYRKLAEESRTNPEVNLTAVVVTKRHHTRFFPISVSQPDPPGGKKRIYPDRDSLGNQNTKPGTFVDQLVTSPYYQDFFLQSHSAIKGTAKPTHYFVLEDGIKSMRLERLRDLVSLLHCPV